MKKILKAVLVLLLLVSPLTVKSAYALTEDTSWYNTTDTEFEIDTEDKLAGLVKLANNGEDFAGKTIKLSADIEITKTHTFTTVKNLVIDGNNNTISSSASFNNTNTAFQICMGADTGIETNNLVLKNITFDGFKESSVIRSQGVALIIDGCTFSNNELTARYSRGAVIRADYTELTVRNSLFTNNIAEAIVLFNYNANNDTAAELVIENSTFENNKSYETAIVYYADGGKATVKDSSFIENEVESTGNAATIYYGFMENTATTGNLFKENAVKTTSTSTRVSGGIFLGYNGVVENNAFDNNYAENADGDEGLGQSLSISTYYGDVEIGRNYFGGKEAVEGKDYFINHKTSGNNFTIAEPFENYEVDNEGNLVVEEHNYVNGVCTICKDKKPVGPGTGDATNVASLLAMLIASAYVASRKRV